MWFHIPVKVYTFDKNTRKSSWKKADVGLQLRDPELKGPALVIRSSGRTVKLDIKSIHGHADPLNLAVRGGDLYKFALLDVYECPENRLMLVRLIEIAKLINKGRIFTPEQLIASMSADPMVGRYRKTWLQIAKEFNIPRKELFMSRVNLTGQNLKTIPASFGNILLREVILDDNLLGETDHFWSWLKGPVRLTLQILSAKNNKLKSFPSQIVMCKELHTINFAYNDLKVLPHKLLFLCLRFVDFSHNVNLLYWPFPTSPITELNIEGCSALFKHMVQDRIVSMTSPPALIDSTATVILHHQKTFKFQTDMLPSTLLDKLNRAAFCWKCNKFYTKPMNQSKCSREILAGRYIGMRHTPVTTLKFDCGCNTPTRERLLAQLV